MTQHPRISLFVWLWFGILGCCMFLFGILTPPMADDYYFGSASLQPFADIMAGAAVQPLEPAQFHDIFRRAVQMYTTWDGRIMAYVTFGFFVWLPQLGYALLVAGLICVTVFLVIVHVIGPDWRYLLRWWHVPLATALLFWGMPTCGSIYFWRTGLAYGVDLCVALLFLLPFRLYLSSSAFSMEAGRVFYSILLACLGLFLGLLQYNTPILCLLAGSAAFWRLWLLHADCPPQERLRRLLPLLVGLVALAAALAVLFSAPGNAERLRIQEGEFAALSLVDKVILYLKQQPRVQLLFWLPWLLTLLAVFLLVRQHERFTFEKGENARRQHSAARPKVSGKTALFPRNDRPYGLKRAAFQTEIAHGKAFWRSVPLPGAAFLLLGQMGQGAYLFASMPAPRAYTSSVIFMLLGACILLRAAVPLSGTRCRQVLRTGGVLFCLCFWLLLPYEMRHLAAGNAELTARAHVLASTQEKSVCVSPLQTRGRPFFPLGTYVQDMAHDPQFWINRIVAAYWGLRSVALCLPPDRYFLHEDAQGRVLLHLRGEMLTVLEWPQGISRDLYVYYCAKSSLISRVPAQICDAVTDWLAQAHAGDARLLSLPVLYSITHLSPDTRKQRLWGIFNGKALPLWLVRPGDGPLSFRILPLREVSQAELAAVLPSSRP